MIIAFIITVIIMAIIIFKQQDDKKLMRQVYAEVEKSLREQQRRANAYGSELVDAKRERDSVKYDLKRLTEQNRELLHENDEQRKALRERSALKAIKFVANVPHKGWTSTEFKLGVGPCGLEVSSITWTEQGDLYLLTQWHTDGSRKVFEYKKTDVQGRIEKYFK